MNQAVTFFQLSPKWAAWNTGFLLKEIPGFRLAEAGMRDMDYLSMIHAIVAGTIPNDLPKKNELEKMDGFWGELSVFTLKDGKSLILN